MLGRRRRRWANIEPALGKRIAFARIYTGHVSVLDEQGLGTQQLCKQRQTTWADVQSTHRVAGFRDLLPDLKYHIRPNNGPFIYLIMGPR